MITELLTTIEGHRALRHTVFTTLAARKYPPDVLTRYLVNMATFCAASRWHGRMVDILDRDGCTAERDAVAKILASEDGHEEQLQTMGNALLGGEFTEQLNHIDEEDLYDRITDGMNDVIGTLTHRDADNLNDVLTALGGMLVVEIAANRQIIPGQVVAFIDSGFYGLTLDDVPYLNEHSGEHGVEHGHEAAMIALVGGILQKTGECHPQGDYVLHGAVEMLDSLAHFYDDLEAILKS